MNPLLVTLACHPGDLDAAKKLLAFIADFSAHDRRAHSCLLVIDSNVAKADEDELGALAKRSFDFVPRIPATGSPGFAPNQMFLAAARWIKQCTRSAWLWLEPDAIPTKPGWLDSIAEEYDQSPMRFLGAFVRQTQDKSLPDVHMSGIGVYPNDAFDIFEPMTSLRTQQVAWDVESHGAVIPRAKETMLIQHYWGTKELVPTFVKKRLGNSPAMHLALDFVKPGTAIFHRNKDGSLIELLRAKIGQA